MNNKKIKSHKLVDDVLDKRECFFSPPSLTVRRRGHAFRFEDGWRGVGGREENHHRKLNGFQMAVSSVRMDYFKVLYGE